MKIYKIALCVSAALIGFTACDDDLDLTPKDRITDADYFKTETDLQLYTNPCYNNLLDPETYDDQHDLMVRTTLSKEMRGGSDRDMPAKGGGGWTWGTLRRINTFIERAGNCPDEAAVVKYTAVARFFRAMFYYDKVRRFGDVPWYDRELGSDDGDLYKARDSRELIMTNIIKDIDYAIENLPDRTKEPSAPYRVTKDAALALKAHFCLFEGTYRKYHGLQLEGNDYNYYLDLAAKAGEEVITRGFYKVYSTGKPAEDYRNLFNAETANGDEFILAKKYDYTMNIRHNATGQVFSGTQGSPGLTRKMVNMYLMKDGSRFTDKPGWQEMDFVTETRDRDPRLAQTVRTPGYILPGQKAVTAPNLTFTTTGYQLAKFVQNPDDYNKQVIRSDMSACDLPVIRYSEVLLDFAEAKAELGTLTQADLDKSINKLRDRVAMPHLVMATANNNPDHYLSSEEYGYPNVTGTNKGVILEIRRERAVEMILESSRWFDLMRWKAGYCVNQPITGMYFPGPGEYDLSGTGTTDHYIYTDDMTEPAGLPADVIKMKIGEGLPLTGGTKGYFDFHGKVVRTPFNEGRDYLYPIPPGDRSLNHNLTQNPGWDDGLNF